jgi:hypothetical protein
VCEDRFNKGGQSWITSNWWRSEADFPLHSALKAAACRDASKDLTVYKRAEIAGVDIGKPTYFAMSVF